MFERFEVICRKKLQRKQVKSIPIVRLFQTFVKSSALFGIII